MIVTIDMPMGESRTLFNVDSASIYKNDEHAIVSVTCGDCISTLAFQKSKYAEAYELYQRIVRGVAAGSHRMKINWKRYGTVMPTAIYFVEYEGD